jgi:transposase
LSDKWDEQVFRIGETIPRKKPTHQLIAEVSVRRSKVDMTIGIDRGDVWSHYCTLNEEAEVIDRGRFRTSPKGVEKWFINVPPARVAMEAGTRTRSG